MRKKILEMLMVSLFLVAMNSMLCMAAEEQKADMAVPEQISIDGCKLVFAGKTEEPDNASRTVQPRYQYIVVTNTDNLNVRSGPGYNYSVIGSFAKGSIVDVSFAQEEGIKPWCYAGGYDASTGNYIHGYIHEDYIEPVGTVG